MKWIHVKWMHAAAILSKIAIFGKIRNLSGKIRNLSHRITIYVTGDKK